MRHAHFVKRGDAFRRGFQRRAGLGVAFFARRGDLAPADREAFFSQIDAVEPLGQFEERVVAAGPHVGDDPGHDVAHVAFRLPLGGDEAREFRLEIGRAGVELKRHRAPPLRSGRPSRRRRGAGS